MIKLPPNGQWKQVNRGDLLGSILGSFNLDLTINPPALRTTGMVVTTVSSTLGATTVDSDLTAAPAGFRFFIANSANKIWMIAGSKVHSNSGVVNGSFSVDATASSPTNLDSTKSDIELFNGNLYVTGGTSLYKMTNTPTWSTNGTGLSGSGTHMLCVYADRLYISNSTAASIYSMSTGDTIATSSTYTLTLTNPPSNCITFMRPVSNGIWIGVTNLNKGKAYMYLWDGSSSQVTKAVRLDAQGALACVIKDDVPWVLDSNGRLLAYNGGQFKEVARLPNNDKYFKNAISNVNDRFIHPNGMSVVNGRINILINNQVYDSSSSIEEFCPSGIWEYDENIGLYHKYSLNYTPSGTTTITSWGQNRVSAVGALSDMKIDDPASNANGILLAGATIYTDSTSTVSGVFINDTMDTRQKFGYLVTPKILTQQLEDSWKNIYIVLRRLINSTDRIMVKMRKTMADPTEATISWTSTTEFTTTTDVSAYVAGDEIEITQGKGGGLCAHITSISVAAGTYTVQIDETATGVVSGNTAKARFQKWTKLHSNDFSSQSDNFARFSVNENSGWIQFKICFLFTNKNEIYNIILSNGVNKKVL